MIHVPHLDHMAAPIDDALFVLSNQEREAMAQLIADLPPLNSSCLDDPCCFLQLDLARRRVPEELAARLLAFRRCSNPEATLLIRNIPTDPTLPPTPPDGRQATDKESFVSEYALLLCIMHLGEPIAYSDEKDGEIIHNVCPVKGRENVQGNVGSTFLEFHTENAFHPHKPDYIGLICLRSDHERMACTISSSIRRIIHRLPAKVIPLLREPLYAFRPVSSFSAPSDESPPLFPILTGDLFDPDMRLDFYHTYTDDPAAQWALDTVRHELMQAVVGIALTPGDLIIVDNRVAAHARTAFTPRYDGTDRWLQRVYIVEDFRHSKSSRPAGKHVCVPMAVEKFDSWLR